MSNVKAKNFQVGADGTASNNFTWYQPAVPDGTVRLGKGNAGGTTQDIIKVNADGGVNTGAPAFSAYLSSPVSFTTGVFTKVTCQTEEFDTNNCYDSTTNYRFQPNVAGYYQINSCIYWGNAGSNIVSVIYKNGAAFKRGNQLLNSASSDFTTLCSALIYLNGSTDYVELYGLQNSGGTLTTQGTTASYNYFQASMVRAA